MVVALSYVLAVIITVALAICLYPIAGVFWVFGLMGKISDSLFRFTRRTIAALWRDLRSTEKTDSNNPVNAIESGDSWTCSCGHTVSGRFCSYCGCEKQEENG